MDRSRVAPFDVEAVTRPLSERGRVQAGPSRAAPAGPAERIEQSKERLARDLAEAEARLRRAPGRALRRLGTVAAVAAALLAVGLVVKALGATRRGRRSWLRILRAA